MFSNTSRLLAKRASKFVLSRRFNSTLTLIETTGPNVTPASLSTLTAAVKVGNPITALLLGPESEVAGKQIAAVEGVDKILISKSDKYAHLLPEEVSPLVASILKSSDYTNFFVPASTAGKGILPRVGALLDVQPVSEITKVVSPDTFVRPTYAGNAILTVKCKDKVKLASVRSSAFVPIERKSEKISDIKEISYVESGNKTQYVSEQLIKSERPELDSAKIEHFDQLLYPLADKLHAALGASRAAVDADFCDNSLQVGQTGKVVAPNLYLAVGISGAIQHLAGMKDSKVIVAINKDEEAPIFKIADVGMVGDLFKIVPELTEKL
ncbi:hypothetical protein HII13_000926 [Brettanomyces bruxellensis]|nr:hypothetical protein HII13_000926 [Brettanomyces bruxellensis]